ncbi:MAG: ArsA-related P-loop ATPase, partial [candidate division WOR-3 bacterium]
TTIDFMKSDSVGYIAVTIPEALSIYQTRRLVDDLHTFGIDLDMLIVNNIVKAEKGCNFCAKRRTMQEKYISEISEKFSGTIIKKISLLQYEIKGINRIREITRILFA